MINLEIGTKLKVIKDIYYIVEDSIEECSYLTKEELFENVSHLLVKDDIWVIIENDWNDKMGVECIEGSWINECNDGWFDFEEMYNKGVFEVIG
jgi:hypothetical protein